MQKKKKQSISIAQNKTGIVKLCINVKIHINNNKGIRAEW